MAVRALLAAELVDRISSLIASGALDGREAVVATSPDGTPFVLDDLAVNGFSLVLLSADPSWS